MDLSYFQMKKPSPFDFLSSVFLHYHVHGTVTTQIRNTHWVSYFMVSDSASQSEFVIIVASNLAPASLTLEKIKMFRKNGYRETKEDREKGTIYKRVVHRNMRKAIKETEGIKWKMMTTRKTRKRIAERITREMEEISDLISTTITESKT